MQTPSLAWRISFRSAVLFCFAVYIAVMGVGLLIEGFGADDWRQVTGAPRSWLYIQGRWVTHFIYQHLLLNHYLTPLQGALAFLCFLGASYVISDYVVDKAQRPLAMALIFVVGANHLYQTDLLHYNSSIFAYPLAMLLAVLAYDVLLRGWGRRGRGWNVMLVLASVQLVALTFGIYQSFAFFALLVPGLVLLRIDRFPARQALWFAVAAAAIFIAGLLLYQVELRAYATLHGEALQTRGYGPPTLGGLVAKAARLPGALADIHTGTLMATPVPAAVVLGLYALAPFGLVAASWLQIAQRRSSETWSAKAFDALRLAVASTGLILAVPVVFWFAYEGMFLPARAVAFVGFLIAPVLLASVTVLANQASGRAWSRRALEAGIAATALVGAVHIVLTSAAWQDRGRVSERDLELARNIYGRVIALPGYAGQPIRTVGDVTYPGLDWGASLGVSVFQFDHAPHDLFHQRFNVPWQAWPFLISPRACPAFPADGSVFLDGGAAYACLAPQQALFPIANCVTTGRPDFGQVCLTGKRAILVRPRCAWPGRDQFELRIRRGARQSEGVVLFDEELVGVEIAGRCYTAAPFDGEVFDDVKLVLKHDFEPVWSETIPRERFSQTLLGPAKAAS